MANVKDPIIIEDTNFTAAESPFVIDLQSFFQERSARAYFIRNGGPGDFILQE